MAKLALVTGGTGMVGNCIAQSLLRRGHRVRALVRSLEKGKRLLPDGCELIEGDVTKPESLGPAVAGCDWVFHAAGFPEQWLKDKATFERINADGTQHMVTAARAAKVGRFIFTSTIDVFVWKSGATYDESELDPEPKNTHYERSKQRADRIVADAVKDGMDAVFIHPAGVYGPAPSDSPGVSELIVKLWLNKAPGLLPGGMPCVYAPDAGEGHVLAAERAKPGARYILSEQYYTLKEIAAEALRALGLDRKPPRVLPLWLCSLVSTLGEVKGSITGGAPLIPKGQLKFLQVDSYPTAKRAIEDLGMTFTALPEGMAKTVAWLKATGKLVPKKELAASTSGS
jgi:dihydroflavonol-4-reductase